MSTNFELNNHYLLSNTEWSVTWNEPTRYYQGALAIDPLKERIVQLEKEIAALREINDNLIVDRDVITETLRAVRHASGAKEGESLIEVVGAKCAMYNMSHWARSIPEVQPMTMNGPPKLIVKFSNSWSTDAAYDRAMKVIE